MTWNFLWSYWTLGKTCFVEWNRTRYATYEKKRSGFIIFFCEGHVLYCWWTILVLVLPWREFCWANFLIFFFKFYKKFHLAFLPAVLLLWLSLSQCKFCCWIMLENPKKKKTDYLEVFGWDWCILAPIWWTLRLSLLRHCEIIEYVLCVLSWNYFKNFAHVDNENHDRVSYSLSFLLIFIVIL